MMRATQSFHALGVFTADGDLLDKSDPIVKAFPSLFVPDDGPVLERPETVGKAVTRPAVKRAPRKAKD